MCLYYHRYREVLVMRLNKQHITFIHNNVPLVSVQTLAIDNVYSLSVRQDYKTLYQCYRSVSFYKERAYNQCVNIESVFMYSTKACWLNGGIASFNCMQFNYYIDFEINGHRFSIKRTAYNDYIIGRKDDIQWLLNNCIDNEYEI